MKINWKKITGIYLIVFGIIMLVYNSVHLPVPIGEWDDYSLPVASILNRKGFSISESDVEVYKDIFPEWAQYIDDYSLSPYTAKNGGQMPWYFPVYAMACIPFTLLLQAMELPTIYAFSYTNLAFFMAALFITRKYLQVDERKKGMLIALLSINPIVFYAGWTSAEMIIYSLLVVAFVSWHNRWYKRAALFVSAAGMLNPTIMSIGFIMIAEYFVDLVKKKESDKSWYRFLKKVWLQVICYGSCYIIGLVPMTYNVYNTGHINLTASVDYFTQGNETTFERFVSYLFDLNYGILPYFSILLITAIALCIPAILHRHWGYLEWIFVFVINVFLYSVMIHINCGMSGIARYNAWGVLPLLFAVCIFLDEILNSNKIINGIKAALSLGVCLTGVIVFSYNPNRAANTSYESFTPIAEWVLANMPCLYNPLHSTFYSRADHVDGGYWYQLPIIYYDNNGYARKILLDQSTTDNIRYSLNGSVEDMEWLNAELDKVSDMSYLSINLRHFLVPSDIVSLETIWLSGEKYNAESYITSGISSNEETHTWTESLQFTDSDPDDCYYIHISVSGLMNDKQQVILLCNEEEIYDELLFGASEIIVPFTVTDDSFTSFSLLLPDAISPMELGLWEDYRSLGLALTSITFEKKLPYSENAK